MESKVNLLRGVAYINLNFLLEFSYSILINKQLFLTKQNKRSAMTLLQSRTIIK